MGACRMIDAARLSGGRGFASPLDVSRTAGKNRCWIVPSQAGFRASLLDCGSKADKGGSSSNACCQRQGRLRMWQNGRSDRFQVCMFKREKRGARPLHAEPIPCPSCSGRGPVSPSPCMALRQFQPDAAPPRSLALSGAASVAAEGRRLDGEASTSSAVPDTPLLAQTKLLRKLSDANLCIRQLRRELQTRDEAIMDFKSQIGVLEMELQQLARISKEVASAGVLPGTRKINGRYIPSHLAVRLEAIHNRLLSQIRDFEVVREIELVWMGMAECVRVMGSFDGWTDGVEMSPEVTGTHTRFTGNLRLLRGQYEVKFLVDGEWHLSPDLVTVGGGLACNNLLIVE